MIYRFMIVDDEYYIRQHIRHCIPWDSYGFQFAGEADGVEQALQLLNQGHVELILLDISMPGQNGIELLKALQGKFSPMPHIIILSGFATFEYAREALAFGVTKYLLKPVNTEELIETINELKKKLDEERIRQDEHQQYLWTSAIARQETTNSFFRFLFSGQSSGHFDGMLETHGIFPHRQYHIIILDLSGTEHSYSTYEEKQSKLQGVNNCLTAMLNQNALHINTQDSHGRSVFIIEKREQLSGWIQDLMKNLTTVCSLKFSLTTASGYSEAREGTAEGLLSAYQDALQYFRLYSIYGQSLDIRNVTFPSNAILDTLHSLNVQLGLSISGHKSELSIQTVRDIFSLMKRCLFPLRSLESEIVLLMEIASRQALNSHMQILEDKNNWVHISCFELLHSGLPLEDIESKFISLFQNFTGDYSREDLQFIEEVVAKATDYIDKNFMKASLSLNSIASELLISPSYLSRSFTKIRGLSLISYVTKCRMDYARNLLETTTLNIAQISEQVGYNDIFYFSKRFKTQWGIPPSKYRQTLASAASQQKEVSHEKDDSERGYRD